MKQAAAALGAMMTSTARDKGYKMLSQQELQRQISLFAGTYND